MANKAFFDTCIVIAWVFMINSIHQNAENVFNKYSEYYWSDNVIEEFNRRYKEKIFNLESFFQDLQFFLENPERELYNHKDLKNFALKHYSGQKKYDVISSILPFWNLYLGLESHVLYYNLVGAINFCLNDLSIDYQNNKDSLDNIMNLIPSRNLSYSKLDNLLKKQGIHSADRKITLDGHDFACKSQFPIDFVTFDYKCCAGAKKVKTLCFDSIKGKNDFLSA